MKLGSLFDGSGTAPLAATMCGITPVWASEIEPYPIKVTKARFPDMLHLGDITKINGAEVEAVDIICGGSPCQDLSVAGKQKGLESGTRSHLFYEMIRIIKEMREATNGKYPKYIIWENVPGAFSSNNGYDFLSVLQGFAEIADPNIHVPKPSFRGKTDRLDWRYAGSIVGDGWSIAWRTVDAQYWGVPQRRRRIYLVLNLAAERAEKILFECKSSARDFEQSAKTRKGAAEDAEGSIGGSGNAVSGSAGFVGRQGADSGSIGYEPECSPTLRGNITTDCVYPINTMVATRDGKDDMRTCFGIGEENDPQFTISATHSHGIICMNPWDVQSKRQYMIDGVYPTLNAGASQSGQAHGVCYPIFCLEGNGQRPSHLGDEYRESNKQYTLNSTEVHGVVYDITGASSNSMKSPNLHNCFTERDVTRTLDGFAGSPDCNQGGNVVVHTIDCRNAVLNEELSGTLQAEPNGGFSCNCINPITYSLQRSDEYIVSDRASTMSARQYKSATDLCVKRADRRYIVRRLTPLECCRLQGFPDWWEDGVEGSDSARYKMWGNGMALPNMLHVMQGIVNLEKE